MSPLQKRCLTSKRPSGQPVNLLIFLSNDFSVILFSTYPKPPTVSINVLFSRCSSREKTKVTGCERLQGLVFVGASSGFSSSQVLIQASFRIHALELNQSPPRPSFCNFDAFPPSVGSSPLALSFQSANFCKSLPLGK